MNLLECIDAISDKTHLEYNIPQNNKKFTSFIPIEAVNHTSSCNFLIKKQDKAKLLFIVGRQRIYLSDLQIINTILSMDNDTISWFIKNFASLYDNNLYKVQFKIDGDIYDGCGIERFPKKKNLLLFTDSVIDINDFIVLLNFIFLKDRLWESMSGEDGFSKRTLCKYISLIDYYSTKSNRSKSFLKDIGYPIENSYPTDNKHIKELFKEIEKFDISLYL